MRLRSSLPAWLAAGLLAVSAAVAAEDARVIYPAGASHPAPPAEAAGSGGPGLAAIVGVLLLGGAGGWLIWRNRAVTLAGREVRQLAIAETRSLGNRQYLVVASYEGKKFLLGVCPGRIDLLSPLSDVTAKEKYSA